MHIWQTIVLPSGSTRTPGQHSVVPEVLLGRILEKGIMISAASLIFPQRS